MLSEEVAALQHKINASRQRAEDGTPATKEDVAAMTTQLESVKKTAAGSKEDEAAIRDAQSQLEALPNIKKKEEVSVSTEGGAENAAGETTEPKPVEVPVTEGRSRRVTR